MSRSTTIFCDECGKKIPHTYGVQPPYPVYFSVDIEAYGSNSSTHTIKGDFCNLRCLTKYVDKVVAIRLQGYGDKILRKDE